MVDVTLKSGEPIVSKVRTSRSFNSDISEPVSMSMSAASRGSPSRKNFAMFGGICLLMVATRLISICPKQLLRFISVTGTPSPYLSYGGVFGTPYRICCQPTRKLRLLRMA